ncbi:hemolysin family protein [Cesiribacter sp. SM1]|uniref:hemolysin family protein n=1 Tax=Cesiribacter sp. SM1 TaxID=2861196 RepID=UPI001CD35893|nr:hemolysin family protein [Cesiribacter sp. SM1]
MEILIVFLLILLNGVFAMSEIALVSAKKPRLEAEAKKGNASAKRALNLANAPDVFLSTVQIGITLIGILTGIYSGEAITTDLALLLASVPFLAPYAGGLAVVIVVVLITFFTLVLGELVPKRIGLSNPEAYAKLLAGPMTLLSKITAPFVWLLTKTSDFVLRIFNIKPAEVRVTEDEIRAMVEEGARGGIVQEVEQDIVERVFHLGDRRISSLMTYRTDVVTIPVHAGISQIRTTLSDTLFSVYPVVEHNLDDVLGVVYLKDMFRHLGEENFQLQDYIKPATYVAETTSAYKALETFKHTGVHYSLVSDEYGTVMGIVTMNDILEALIGDSVELGTEEWGVQQRDDGSWLIDGDYPFHDFLHYFDIPSDDQVHHFDTLGGLILNELGYIPKEGDKLHWSGLELEVIDMDRVKIDKVLVRRIDNGFTD